MPTISQEYHAEVAQRPKAPVLKTGCATHSGSSNLPLGVTIFKDAGVLKQEREKAELLALMSGFRKLYSSRRMEHG